MTAAVAVGDCARATAQDQATMEKPTLAKMDSANVMEGVVNSAQPVTVRQGRGGSRGAGGRGSKTKSGAKRARRSALDPVPAPSGRCPALMHTLPLNTPGGGGRARAGA